MTAYVDPNICIGCTLCAQLCPEVFKMEQDKAIAYVNPVPADVNGTCREAADGCPVNAIRISD